MIVPCPTPDVPEHDADHDDRYYTETEIDNLLAGKADDPHDHDDRYYTETETDGLLDGKADIGHDHDDRYYTETETDSLLDGKADIGHNHDDRYYTESEIDALLEGLGGGAGSTVFVARVENNVIDVNYAIVNQVAEVYPNQLF